MSDRRPDPRLLESADIVFCASVRAESMRFTSAPRNAVVFYGEPGEESASGGDRNGLPRPVAEGRTYRAVRVDYAIASRLIPPGDAARRSGGGDGDGRSRDRG